MKRLTLSLLSVLLLTQCHTSHDEIGSSDLLIGSWKSVPDGIVIEFDRDFRYTVRFSPKTAFECTYRLSPERRQLSIHDAPMAHQCKYQFISENELKLTRIDPPPLTDFDTTVSLYQRIH